MATRDTIQELEDILPTRRDLWLDLSSTTHRLVGRDRPCKINSRFGRRRICLRQHLDEFRNPGFPNCERSHDFMNPEFKRKVHVAEAFKKKNNLPVFTGRQIAFMIYAVFKINDVQVRAMNTTDPPQYQRQSQEVRSVLGRNP